ncbi:hypothetical protein DV096_11055 [Bradymonadaceae bacterium TMQ3]|uniref:Uncharacterized protein n=1 Tax=Lujinxingia sediminis TaxID=2480984 RepID=A0ABY0CNS7_9DELT|nr:MXAN_5187 C-terminal domain-containing protein [Lujinxingia sediminis]RDV38337.1 hypothetical protein DV096_11055 [Bradymonadaceae bacterium TMQ3]RVU40684.1 hypothetical protein EA187_19915 [Lujinxingia sediminis]TXC76010.1 hypothetical protein FRC91_10965 [Bradymonadales bacterium TMQ1]
MAGRDLLSQSEIDAMLNNLERQIDRLRVLYERYFNGVDRRPPGHQRQEVVRLSFELEHTFINNTAQKFRLRALVQRFQTFKTYWDRTLRQIEEGTYKRDRNKAERRQERRKAREAREDDGAYSIDLDNDFIEGLNEVDLDALLGDAISAVEASEPAAIAPTQTSAASSASTRDEAERERIRREKLAEIQRQLGLMGDEPAPAHSAPTSPAARSAPAAQTSPTTAPSPHAERPPSDPRSQKLAAMRRKLAQRNAEDEGAQASSADTEGGVRGASPEKLARMKAMREKLASRSIQRPSSGPIHRQNASPAPPSAGTRTTGSHRVVRRPSSSEDDSARQVYERLIEAKRRCNEPTDKLSYDAVKRSMDRQREELQRSRGARNVDFQVVIKGGKAYLKPDTKD